MAYVMICDDDDDFASAVTRVLRGDGHEVGVELEPTHLVSRVEQRPPDLLILDVMFPESSSAGLDLARTIRQGHENLNSMPILMLTAVNQRFPLRFDATDMGDDWLPGADFLEKPVDLDVLQCKVSAMLAGAASVHGNGRS